MIMIGFWHHWKMGAWSTIFRSIQKKAKFKKYIFGFVSVKFQTPAFFIVCHSKDADMAKKNEFKFGYSLS